MIVPILKHRPVTLPQFSTEHVELWNALCDLADRHPTGWVLIGGQIAHRFARGSTRVDVLVPEGLGPRTDRRTVGRATTVEVHGGTQALQRAERVPNRVGDRTALVPRLNLLGAIIIKAAASGNDPRPPPAPPRPRVLDFSRRGPIRTSRSPHQQGPPTTAPRTQARRPHTRGMATPRRPRYCVRGVPTPPTKPADTSHHPHHGYSLAVAWWGCPLRAPIDADPAVSRSRPKPLWTFCGQRSVDAAMAVSRGRRLGWWGWGR